MQSVSSQMTEVFITAQETVHRIKFITSCISAASYSLVQPTKKAGDDCVRDAGQVL